MADNNLLSFESFATSVSTTGAINRWPRLGNAFDVVTYSIYLNGETARKLPESYQEKEFNDVILHATTEKLGLDPASSRDNLKVGELVTIREAWMKTVLDASSLRNEKGQLIGLPDDIQDEFALLSEGLVHPWIKAQIAEQQSLNLGLREAIIKAEEALGRQVEDIAPDVVSIGKVLAQTGGFTVQETVAGEVVTHENRRLNSLPSIGDEVLVSYYRGQGQVMQNRKDLTISDPYIDPLTKDFAVDLVTPDGSIKETLLFNSISSIAKFQEAESLDVSFVGKAMDARILIPKETNKDITEKYLNSDLYIDATSGFLAVDFTEDSISHTVLFDGFQSFVDHSKDIIGITPDMHNQAFNLEFESMNRSDTRGKSSRAKAIAFIESEALKLFTTNINKGNYAGSILEVTDQHVIQDIGQRTAIVHDKNLLDRVPKKGEKLNIKYENMRAKVEVRDRSHSRSSER